jgi:hypothetical protein
MKDAETTEQLPSMHPSGIETRQKLPTELMRAFNRVKTE